MLERGTGIALWKQIATHLRSEISAGQYGEAGKLPNEIDLADRWQVNRHTVRRAIQALSDEGLVTARRGEGTYVRPAILDYPISRRTRFHEIAASQARQAHGTLLDSFIEPADPLVATKLQCREREAVIRMETLYSADLTPVSMSTSWFVERRFPGLADRFRALGSLTRALAETQNGDYRRAETGISARTATAVEIERLRIAEDPVVIVNEYVNVDATGRPIQFARTRFAATRVQLVVEPNGGPSG